MREIYKKEPLVTVYITNHNYGRFLQKAIESVLGQTLQNFELIIIDDGSTDDSYEILKKYEKNKKILVIKQKKKGLIFSNNIALRLSKAKYIIRLDADDWLDKHALEIMYNTHKRNKNLSLVFPDYYEVSEDGKILSLFRRMNIKKVKVFDKPAHGACTMFNKELLVGVGGYSELINCQDGFDIWLKLLKRYKFANINLPLFFYRKHSLSLSNKKERILKNRSKIFQEYVHNNPRIKSAKDCIAIIPIGGYNLHNNSFLFKKLLGKPLINWVIDTALKTKIIKKIVVVSADNKVINYLKKKYKDKILMLLVDVKTSLPNISADKNIQIALKLIKKKKVSFNYIFLINFRSPFIDKVDFENAFYAIKIFSVHKIVTIVEENSIFYRPSKNGLELLNNNPNLKLERDILLRDTGSFKLVKKNFFNKKKILIGHIVLTKKSSYYIETIKDFRLSRYLI